MEGPSPHGTNGRLGPAQGTVMPGIHEVACHTLSTNRTKAVSYCSALESSCSIADARTLRIKAIASAICVRWS